MYLKKSLQRMFLIFFSLLYKTLLNKKQNKVFSVKAHDKPVIFNNLLNKFSACFKFFEVKVKKKELTFFSAMLQKKFYF